MGLFLRRRRPVMRLAAGAAVAGTAYHLGSENAEQQQVNDQAQDAYAATQGPPAAALTDADPAGEVERLAQLHASGALTDDEFAAAKAKALGI
jgi:Short C-terminal domain